MTSQLPVHMPVDGSHRDLKLPGQFQGRPAILGHVSDFPDLFRRQLVIALWTLLEFFQILPGN